MKPITVAILIPVYNVEAYVIDCIESILAQVDTCASLYIMNDASTDNSYALLKKYDQHPQVNLYDAPKNRGLSATRNALMRYAKEEYIWFIDSDDLMAKGAYQAVIEHLQTLGSDVVCADYKCLRGDKLVAKKAFIGRPNHKFKNINNQFMDNVIKNNSNHVWNKIFRKSLVADIPFKEGVNFEDIYYMTDLSAKKFSFSYLNKPIISYREREGSIVKSLNKKYVDDYLGAFIDRVERYERLDDTKDGFDYLAYKAYKRYVGLIKKIEQYKHEALLNDTIDKYEDIFNKMYISASKKLPLYQRLNLNVKKENIKKIMKNRSVVNE